MEDAIKLWLKVLIIADNTNELFFYYSNTYFSIFLYPPQIGNVEKLQQAVLDGYGWFLKDQSSRSTNVYHDDIILYTC